MESNVASQIICDEITFNGDTVLVEKWTPGYSKGNVAKIEFQFVKYDSLA